MSIKYSSAPSSGGSGTLNIIKEDGTQVGDSDITTLDFLGADFNLTESPDKEINISLEATAFDSRFVNITGDTMTGVLYGYFTTDTRDTILALTPTAGQIAFATDMDQTEDSYRFLMADGTDWRVLDIPLFTDSATPNMGWTKDNVKSGYHKDWLTDKTLNNILIGGSARSENGGLRIDVTQNPDTFEIYLRDAWQTIIYDLTTEDGDFRHLPIGEEVYVWRGDSVAVGLNGRSRTQEYNTSMGAYPPARILDGGSF